MKLAAATMEHALAYRLWQAPFAEKKLAPVLAHNDLLRVRRVLDVGCGPGTNTHHFDGVDYLGVDINERYVNHARRRYRRNFVVADIREGFVAAGRFDFILVNSLLHHIDTEGTRRILGALASLLSDDGHLHILDLVLPSSPSIALLLARWDRGDFPRPLATWQRLFERDFEPLVFEPYALGALGVTLWEMVYFKGRARRA
ncbi:MAG: class I SAM-dependent methyltransferase [Acidobacteriota bacterium]